MSRLARRAILQPKTVVAGTTWNPADKNANITLSGGNLVATKGGANAFSNVRGTNTRTTGSYTTTMNTADGSGYPGVGFANATASLSNFLGNDTNSIMVLGTGIAYFNGTSQDLGLTFTTGDTVTARLDVSGGRVYFSVNGGGEQFITYTPPGGTAFPALCFFTTPTQATSNFTSFP